MISLTGSLDAQEQPENGNVHTYNSAYSMPKISEAKKHTSQKRLTFSLSEERNGAYTGFESDLTGTLSLYEISDLVSSR